ncbi:MAG: methyltransferase domain-containing protein [Nevskia sp.]|nr:methyltransferase domain-containing protein [Nevskia sp.]
MSCVVCPKCGLALERAPRTWKCPRGHSFDVAREGYVNLLLVQHKSSRDPGDNPEMVRSRRAFLDDGHYRPLRDAAVARLAPLGARSLLDAGCGEGYYTDAFTSVAAEVYGLDISRPAIQLAARRTRGVTWLVGSSAVLPFADASLDLVCNLFCQPQVAQMHRVLAPGGHVLLVTPAPSHLLSLREALFEQVREHEPDKFLAGFDPLFELRERDTVRFPLHLERTALQQLLQMTPYAWKARPDRRTALEQAQALDTEAVFSLLLFRRK